MAQYLLAVHIVDDQPPLSAEELQRSGEEINVLNEELKAAGVWVFGGGLHPAATATVVRSVDGQIVTTDGPFAEAKESLGGFWIIEVDDLDAALAWAAKGTVACRLPVEVRPFDDGPADPAELSTHGSSPDRTADA